jgi:hypothetical protein
MDHLSRDVLEAERLGYGCRYGDFKTDHPYTHYEGEDREPEQEHGTVLKNCQHCGKEFYATAQQSNKLYCSEECRIKHNNEKENQRRKNATRAGKPAVCPICGSKFISIRTAKYCGPDCINRAKSIQATENNRRRREKRANERKQNHI